jgi:hypothetical protein
MAAGVTSRMVPVILSPLLREMESAIAAEVRVSRSKTGRELRKGSSYGKSTSRFDGKVMRATTSVNMEERRLKRKPMN